jgi:hypothetical protein
MFYASFDILLCLKAEEDVKLTVKRSAELNKKLDKKVLPQDS